MIELADAAAARPPRRGPAPGLGGEAWRGEAARGGLTEAGLPHRTHARKRGGRLETWRGVAVAVRSPAESRWLAGVGSCADYVHPNLIQSEDRRPSRVT